MTITKEQVNRILYYCCIQPEGRSFTLLTDQAVLKYLKDTEYPKGPIAQFALESLEFSYDVRHVKGSLHTVADFLSHHRSPD
jgi:hypothetical protein